MVSRMSKLSFVVVLSLLAGAALLVSACSFVLPVPTPTPTLRPSLPSPLPTTASVKAASTSTDVPVRAQKGFRAPDFTLLNLEGGEVNLCDFRGRPVLINFWATWCPPCRAELPAIQEAYQNSDNLVVLGLNFQESPQDVKSLVAFEGLTFPVLLDEGGSVALKYRARGLPTSFFVDPQGIITAVHIGPMTKDQIANYVAQAGGE